MGKRPKRKVVLVLVEGKSDREALKLAISELYDRLDDRIEVFFPIVFEENHERGGDITSKLGVWPRNIEDNIYKYFLRDFFDTNKIMPKDIYQIVHIVDLDGAYISDDKICEGVNPNGEERPYYTDASIITENVDGIIKRNERKRENIDFLSTTKHIKVKQKTVPYSVYYFSSNLDHFLHNNANMAYSMKVGKADEFAESYIGKIDEFIKVFSDDPDAALDMSYEQSWEFIKKEDNSLKRHTNLNVWLAYLQDRT